MLKYLKKVNFDRIFWFLFYFFLFCLLLRNSYNYLDPDFGWHLQVGREISSRHEVPDINYYNYPYTGSWVDHEWLSNYLLHLGFDSGNYFLVSVFFALLVVIVLAMLHRQALRIWPDVPMALVVFLQSTGVIASLPHFGIRIQEISLFFLALVLLILSYYDRLRDKRVLFFLPGLFFLWACSHAGFLIGLFILGAWLGIKFLQLFLAKVWPNKYFNLSNLLSGREAAMFFGFVLASFAATLVTPYYFDLYSFLGGYSNIFYQSHIQEWLPQTFFPFSYWQLFYLALLVGVGILHIYEVCRQKKTGQLDLWQIFLVLLFVAMSFKSRRHFPLMVVASSAYFFQAWRDVFYGFKDEARKRINHWLRIYLIGCLALVAIFQILETKFVSDPSRAFCREYPCGAVDFLKINQEYRALPIFNNYGWGGYLIWQLPDWPLFIDGRLPQTIISDRTYLEEYYDFFKTDEKIEEQIVKYGIKLALIPARYEKVAAQKWEKVFFSIEDRELGPNTNLRDYFYSHPEWQLIYNDDTSLLFKRSN